MLKTIKNLEDLNDIEETILIACCEACGYRLHKHIPIEAIARELHGYVEGRYFKKYLKTLISSQFIIKHPTRHKMTYNLSKYGLKSGIKLKKEC